MSEEFTINYILEVDISPETMRTVRQAQALLYRTANLLRRLGLPERLDRGIMLLQRFTTAMNTARVAVLAFYAASGPVGWALAGVGIVASTLTMGDLLAGY